MYKISSDRRQAALARGRLADWVTDENSVSVDEQYRQVKEGMAIIQNRIAASASQEEKKRLGVQKQEMQAEAGRLRRILRGENRQMRGVEQFIVDAAKEILTPSQFDLIYRAGVRWFEEDREALDALKVQP